MHDCVVHCLMCSHGTLMSREDEKNKKICCHGSLSPFCLGMMDYNCNGVPEPKRKKLRLSMKKGEKPKPLSTTTCFNNCLFMIMSEKTQKLLE